MSDLISRQAAIDAIGISWGLFDARKRVQALPSAETTGALDDAIAKYVADGLMELPSADRPTGEWNDLKVVSISRAGVDELQEYRCSNCDRWLTTPYMYYPRKYNYCPWCGADMRGDKHGD